MPHRASQSVAHSVLTKHTTLNTLSHTNSGSTSRVRPALEIPKTPPLLTPRRRKVLSMWMDGVSNNAIAAALSIMAKRSTPISGNIRMKLHLGNRFSPFPSLPGRRLTVRHDVVPFFIIAELLSLHQKWRYRLQKYPVPCASLLVLHAVKTEESTNTEKIAVIVFLNHNVFLF